VNPRIRGPLLHPSGRTAGGGRRERRGLQAEVSPRRLGPTLDQV